ncbi:MAG: zinc-ribbon domain-containing protein [Clostridiales bacterium]|nr:zinc-ribbon domain-containing protein [Clostridiales bacterium]
MAFCAKCGKELNEDDKVCSSCGEPVGVVRSEVSGGSNETLMGILAYLGVLALIPYLVKDQTSFVRSHALRGMNLLLLEVIAWVAVGIFSWVPVLDSILSGLVGLASFVLSLIGIINVDNHDDKDLPFIGTIRLIK